AGTASNNDYTAISGTMTFQPGETEKTIEVPITPDDNMEPTETFAVKLLNPVGLVLHKNYATGTIVDDDVEPLYQTPPLVGGLTTPLTIDASWNGSGTVSASPDDGSARGVTFDPDGRTIVFGSSSALSATRYNPNGTPDTTFGGTGTVAVQGYP